jgi:YfiH family protein
VKLATRLTEAPVGDGSVPRFELAEWRGLGILAGVTGRGTGPEPFDLGLATDQPIGRVLDRWRAFGAAAGFGAMIVARQVHGTRVLWHDRAGGLTIFEGADGHATRSPDLLLTVSLADCIPVYLVDPVRPAIALLHSGWKGTAGRILDAGLQLLTEEAGSTVGDVLVHCGVGICESCYEVGSEVARACGRPVDGPKGLLDLRSAIAEQALAAGVAEVSISTLCPAHDHDRFFSHRASAGRDGRMVAYLGIPGRGSGAER